MDLRSLLEHLFGFREDLQKYLETRVSYYGLAAFEKAVRLLTAFIGNGLIVVILLIAMIFLSGAAAVYLGSLLNSTELGLLIVGGFFVLLALVLILFRNKIFGPFIIKSLSDVFFKEDETNS